MVVAGGLTVVASESELVLESNSAPATLAVLVIVPAPLANRTTVKVDTAPGKRVPSVHVTVPVDSAQLASGALGLNVVPAGTMSVT